ncbi:hypothetical protein [Streptomyces sp. NPDC090022]|uniref:hypothetical protein n=1 Tax=Streptomyces sp. NPDC090022 TaxID=3365920 RepID=UPI00382405C7
MTGHGHEQHHPRGTAAPQAGHENMVCPVCGRPVGTVVWRRKVLGAFVPAWGPGPCRNPDCSAFAPAESSRG